MRTVGLYAPFVDTDAGAFPQVDDDGFPLHLHSHGVQRGGEQRVHHPPRLRARVLREIATSAVMVSPAMSPSLIGLLAIASFFRSTVRGDAISFPVDTQVDGPGMQTIAAEAGCRTSGS